MLIPVVLSFSLCSILTPFCVSLGRRFGVVDLPGPLKLQSRPVSRLGGLGIFCGMTAGLLMLSVRSHVVIPSSCVMFIVGVLDDRYNLSPGIKLFGQAVAGVVLAGSLLHSHGLHVETVLGGLAALVLTVLMANAVNLLDGMDGLAAGSAAIAFASLTLMDRLHGVTAEGGAVFAAATLGFLVWNFPRAKIFMGDGGSLVLGGLLAYMLTELLLTAPRLFLCGVVASGVPIFDLGTGIVRRWLGRKSLFSGDREHFYDRLRITLKNDTEVVILIFCFGILLGALALVLSFQPLGVVAAAAATLAAALLLGARALGWLATDPEEARVRR